MLAICCTLLHDTFEGGASNDPWSAEWPPSPMRLFSALVSVAVAGSDDDGVLETLEELPPPKVFAPQVLPDGHRGWLRRSFVPTNSTVKDSKSSTYPARTNGARSWSRVCPRSPRIWYVWPDADLQSDARDQLRILCRRVPYFGRSTSPALVEVRDVVADDEYLERLVPDPEGRAGQRLRYRSTIRVPFPGALNELRAAHEAKYVRGEPGDPWAIGRAVDYGVPTTGSADHTVEGPYRTLVIFRLDGPTLDGRNAARVTSAVRRALMSRASEHLAILHGHQEGGVVQCAVVALPFVGDSHADGHLLGVALALPTLRPEEARVLNDALPPPGEGFDVTAGPLGVLRLQRLTPVAARGQAQTLDPSRWAATARTWVTALPLVLDRFLKRHDDPEAAVRRAVVHSGFPEPHKVELSIRPMLTGAVDLRPTDVLRHGADKGFKPYRHARITFPDKVRGPVVVGSMRHYGLGLCLPLDGEDANDSAQ